MSCVAFLLFLTNQADRSWDRTTNLEKTCDLVGNLANECFIFSAPTLLRQPQAAKSIWRILQPQKDLKKTRTYCGIYEKVKDKQFQILHCHGVPGSGKSQAVLKLSESFYETNGSKPRIGWHIRCVDFSQNVKESLKKLAEELQRDGWITDHTLYSINDDLDTNGAGKLVGTLFDCDAHILMVIEDPQSQSIELLGDLCRQIIAKSNESRECKLQLYLTSHKKIQILSSDEMKMVPVFQSELLEGFNEEEAVDFLKEASQCATSDAAAKEIFKRFSGLPLGLKAAREYCIQSSMNYEGYLNFVEEDELVLEEEERDIIVQEFGSSARHVFQAIAKPFKPAKNNPKSTLHWKMLCCLSYLHHDCVPQLLLERCCYLLADQRVKKSQNLLKVNTGQLITKLGDYGMCSKTSEKDIRLHQVVLNAFRVHHRSTDGDNSCLYVKTAIEALCSLVTKDLRKKGAFSQMSSFLPHIQSLLAHVEPIDKVFDDDDRILYKAFLSHLCNVTGTIMSSASPSSNEESNKYFEKAIDFLWQQYSQQVVSDCNCDVEDFSKAIVTQSAIEGDLLPPDFTLDYASKLIICFDESELDFVKSTCGHKFKIIQKTWQTHGAKKELIKQLQECNVFLNDKKYRRVFYAERLACILRSWSRTILDANLQKVKEDTKCDWRSSLSRSISIQCRSMHQVPLLCEWLNVSASLAIWLKQKKGPDYLKKASNLCHEILSADLQSSAPTYENGLIMEVSFSFLKSTLIRNLIRIYARRKDLTVSEIEEGNKLCQSLHESSKADFEKYSNSASCLVYCAKYYASLGDFAKSFNCFNDYFTLTSESSAELKFFNYSWAVYNYARAINSAPNFPQKEKEIAKMKCEAILNSEIALSEDLNRRLVAELQKLT